eukprot:6404718-Prorocentrum_lima.AAC.1
MIPGGDIWETSGLSMPQRLIHMVPSYFLTAARHIRPYPPRGSGSVCSGTPQPSGNLCTTRCAKSCATLVLHHPTPGMSAQPETCRPDLRGAA